MMPCVRRLLDVREHVYEALNRPMLVVRNLAVTDLDDAYRAVANCRLAAFDRYSAHRSLA